jgi:hypothetical protein
MSTKKRACGKQRTGKGAIIAKTFKKEVAQITCKADG